MVPREIFPRPVLLVVVDTEEEFDWSQPFDRSQRSVGHLRAVGRFQDVCDEAEVAPVYVVDHPIATTPEAVAALREIHERGACEIGAHLHPWVSPPHDEQVSARNSYPGNLPRALERAKIERLTEAIESAFGARPRAYKSGRYGFGPHTGAILDELGYEVDLSPAPPFDLRADGGPDWSRAPAEPYRLDTPRRLLAAPNTGGFVGWAGGFSRPLYALASSAPGRALRLGGILARLGAVERLFLSPEGYAGADLVRLTRALLGSGVRVFVLSLHSPSFEPGHTPYVRDARELHSLLESCRNYFRFFLEELGGQSLTASDLRRHVAPNMRTRNA
ncbi:MAG: polysaccharide deacetylase family protein [Planctomycetes bacterium]|nr:polysaccharide deacetylase family protein [Planctomycetota bacterium]